MYQSITTMSQYSAVEYNTTIEYSTVRKTHRRKPHSLISPQAAFSILQNILWITFILHSCHRSSTAAMVQSVRLSVRPSVCLSVCLSHLFSLCSHHHITMTFSGVITNDRSDVHAKGQGQRSKVKVTEVKTQFSRFRTITPIWINIWWWNDAQSLMLLRKGALLFSMSSVKF